MSLFKYLFSVLFFIFAVVSVHGQVIPIKQSFNQDTTIYPFDSINNQGFYSLKGNFEIDLNSDTSLVRIVLNDEYNFKYLIYEAFPLLDTVGSFNVSNYGDETILLDSVIPKSVSIIIDDADLNIISLEYSTRIVENIESKRDSIKHRHDSIKIYKLNENLKELGYIWRAGETRYSKFNHNMKTKYFGERFNFGFEYYKNGFYMTPKTNINRASSEIVRGFDWRNRHGANNPNSQYYDDDPDGSGWLTLPSYQEGCLINGVVEYLNSSDCEDAGGTNVEAPTCWAFGPIAAIEAVTNLYFNQHLDIELSQQEVISCSWSGGANAGHTQNTLDYAMNNGIVNEECFPYTTFDGDCENDICQNPTDVISITNYEEVAHDEIAYKTNLINNGPLSAIHATWSHAFTLVGYGIVKVEDYIDYTTGETIQCGSPYIGSTYWIFRNSGLFTGWPYHISYTYMLDMPRTLSNSNRTDKIITPILSENYNQDSIKCNDFDNDGYYNWGIGPKPSSCPNCPDEPDCDDSNPFLGPFDDRYGCTLLCENFHYDNTPITIDEDETWYDVNYINQDIIVNNDTLYIFDELQMHDSASITVKNGGVFILGENATLKGACNDTIYSCNITVEPGGILKLEDSTNVYMNSSGSIFVDHNQTNDGKLIVDKNFNLQLLDNSTYLEIKGELEICDTTTFTYTGDGYIKFSNPGGDATNNIFCGTNSSFILQGSGQNDKIMEVQQSTVRFPDGLSSLEFRDGKIEMGPDRRMLAQVNDQYPIVMDNIKITSDDGTNNAHRSFWLYGQNDVTIQNCTFENGKYGLGAHNTYGGASITLSGSDFINNQTGLKVYDKGVHLNSCNFYDNTNKAIECGAMSFTSDVINCDIEDSEMGIDYWAGGNANLNVRGSTLLGNGVTGTGIWSFGTFFLNMDDMACNRISNFICGINANDTKVNITNDARNNLSKNIANAIYTNNGNIYLSGGYNQLYTLNDANFTLEGNIYYDYCPFRPPYITKRAHNNRWETSSGASPVFGSNYSLYNSNPACPTAEIHLEDNNPAYRVCMLVPPTPLSGDSANDDLISVSLSDNTTMQVDDAVSYLSNQADNANSVNDYQHIISEFVNIVQTTDAYGNNYETAKWKNMACGTMYSVLSDFYAFTDYDKANNAVNQSIDQIIGLNNDLISTSSDISGIEYKLNNALLNRFREKYALSISQLESLISEIATLQFGADDNMQTLLQNKKSIVEKWLCHLYAEQDLKNDIITFDEFAASIETCNSTFENTMETIHARDSLNDPGTEPGEDTSPSPNLTIIPNPNPGNFTIEVYCETAAGDIKINNIYGQSVRTITLTGDGQQSVQVSGLAQGQYTVYYLQNGTVLDSESMIVE